MNFKTPTQLLMATLLFIPGYLVASGNTINKQNHQPSTEIGVNCEVNIASEASIQRYLERGLRTNDAGGSLLTYKTLYQWNTVGVEIKFDNGNRVSGINVRITPGYSRAKISMDFPDIGSSGVYYLTSDGVLKSSDGTFTYRCR